MTNNFSAIALIVAVTAGSGANAQTAPTSSETAEVGQSDADQRPPREAMSGPPTGKPVAARAGVGGPPDSVFDDTWISVGFGAAYSPSYTGSDDYIINPLPVLQGSIAGIGIAPRPAGLALDFVKDAEDGPTIDLGPVFRLRNDRANQIEDATVKLAGELDRAFEVGASGQISFPGILNPVDSIRVGADIRWDIAGAHSGMTIDPSISYFTPINRGTVVSLSLGLSYVDDDFANYYFTVDPAASTATGLPAFSAEGGVTSYSATTLIGIDLDGNALNGGWGAVIIGGYSRLTGDAADTPFTSVVGSKDQFIVGTGISYTF